MGAGAAASAAACGAGAAAGAGLRRGVGVVVGLLLGAGLACVWWSCWPVPPRHPTSGATDRIRDTLVQAGVTGVGPATLLPAGLALFWAAASAVARLFWGQGLARVFVFAIALAVFEWLRGHILTGFPWNVVGYALTYPLPLMQSAALFGAYGLTAIAAFIFPAPLVMMADRKEWLTRADIVRASAVALVPRW